MNTYDLGEDIKGKLCYTIHDSLRASILPRINTRLDASLRDRIDDRLTDALRARHDGGFRFHLSASTYVSFSEGLYGAIREELKERA